MSDKKLYSLLLAWNINDMEEGTYSITVEAVDYKAASTQAREAMFQIHCDGFTEEQEQEARDEGIYYVVLDSVEGANIWSAPDMLVSLKTVQAMLRSFPAIEFTKHRAMMAELAQAIERGEKLQ